ncbi:hypothetical protein D3C77_625940 [compost metagenome]
MRHRRRHFAEGAEGFTGHQFALLGAQEAGSAANDPEQAKVDQRAAQQRRRPDQYIAALDTPNQILRLLVNLDHRQHLRTAFIEHWNVVFNEQVLRLAQEFLFIAVFVGLVVAGRDGHLRIE